MKLPSWHKMLWSVAIYYTWQYCLQNIQNSLDRVVTNSNRHVHVTPMLRNSQWLPTEYRSISERLHWYPKSLGPYLSYGLTDYLYGFLPFLISFSNQRNILTISLLMTHLEHGRMYLMTSDLLPVLILQINIKILHVLYALSTFFMFLWLLMFLNVPRYLI